MATPRGAEHRDLEQRLADIEDQLRDLTGAALRREQLKVDSGDFVVSGGGGVLVRDGGGVTVAGGGDVTVAGGGGVTVGDGGDVTVQDGAVDVRGEGVIVWHDPQGRERFRIGRHTEQESGGDALRLVYLSPNGSERVSVGQILDKVTGATIGHGLLVENGNGNDLLAADNSGIWIARPDGKVLLESGSAEDNLMLSDNGGDPYLWVSHPGDAAGLYGGREGNGALSTLVKLQGQAGGATRQVEVRDGADSTYVPIGASEFDVRSSSVETKDVLGDPEGDALAEVRGTPIKRWRHRTGGRSARVVRRDRRDRAELVPDGEPDETPERIGPMWEDVPAIMASEAEGGGIKLSAALWTLWGAVQQLADENDGLRERLQAVERA